MHNGFSPSRRAWNRVMTVLVWAAAVLVMVSDHVVLSALPAEKLGPRLGLSAEDFMQEENCLWKSKAKFLFFPARPGPERVRCSKAL